MSFESAGCPEWYAWSKFDKFGEAGPAILILDVPDQLIALTAEDGYTDPKYGVVQFDKDAGLRELLAEWHDIKKRILRLAVRPPHQVLKY